MSDVLEFSQIEESPEEEREGRECCRCRESGHGGLSFRVSTQGMLSSGQNDDRTLENYSESFLLSVVLCERSGGGRISTIVNTSGVLASSRRADLSELKSRAKDRFGTLGLQAVPTKLRAC